MVILPKIISLVIGVTKIEFCIRGLREGEDHRDDYAEVAVAMAIDEGCQRLESIPTLIALKDLYRLGEYIDAALTEVPDYDYVPMSLGFSFSTDDSDDYITTVSLFFLSGMPDGERRSYFGFRGPVLNEVLVRFANEFKEIAMINKGQLESDFARLESLAKDGNDSDPSTLVFLVGALMSSQYEKSLTRYQLECSKTILLRLLPKVLEIEPANRRMYVACLMKVDCVEEATAVIAQLKKYNQDKQLEADIAYLEKLLEFVKSKGAGNAPEYEGFKGVRPL